MYFALALAKAAARRAELCAEGKNLRRKFRDDPALKSPPQATDSGFEAARPLVRSVAIRND